MPKSKSGDKWTARDDAKLARLWEGGLSATSIAWLMRRGFTRDAVLGRIKRLGLQRRAATTSWTAERDARLTEMLAAGMKFKDIGAALGTSGVNCYYRARRLGLETGRRPGSKPVLDSRAAPPARAYEPLRPVAVEMPAIRPQQIFRKGFSPELAACLAAKVERGGVPDTMRELAALAAASRRGYDEILGLMPEGKFDPDLPLTFSPAGSPAAMCALVRA